MYPEQNTSTARQPKALPRLLPVFAGKVHNQARKIMSADNSLAMRKSVTLPANTRRVFTVQLMEVKIMDSVTFAELACWMQRRVDRRLVADDLQELHDMCKHAVPAHDNRKITAQSVRKLLAAIPERKIEAIKMLREMTGDGLKEAKDQIEAVTTHRDLKQTFGVA
jgi:ribosomal protein L7/L12